MTDWAGWGTSVGTLALAGATVAAIRSSNRSARIAERALLSGLRPLLVVAGREDPAQEVQFADGRVFEAGAREPLFRPEPDAVYLAIPLRNAGSGIAQLLGYRLEPAPAERVLSDPLGPALHRRGAPSPALEDFSEQQRDLYIAAGEVGFWQAALRDPASELHAATLEAHRTRGRLTIDLLYGDLEGGQPTISRFVLLPRASGSWRCDSSHHWRELPPQGGAEKKGGS